MGEKERILFVKKYSQVLYLVINFCFLAAFYLPSDKRYT